MRIVLATTAQEKGGVWRHVIDVATGLRARGHQVELDVDRSAPGLRDDARARGFTQRGGSFRSHADVWHIHLADTYSRDSFRSLLSARRSGTRAVITEHLPRTDASDPSARVLGGMSRPASWAAKTAFKQVEFSLADRVIAVSESSRRFLLTRYGIGSHKVVTIPNGVRRCTLAALSSPAAPPRFVAIGSVIAQKGFDLLIEAAALAEVPWSVEIVGDGPHLGALRTRASHLATSVHFLGRREDIAGCLSSATALVVPSRWEAWPYVAMEAMQQGVAVVATRVDGLPEIVNDRVTGLVVDPLAPRALAGALDELAAEPLLAQVMGANGQQRVAQFDEELMLDRLEHVYAGTTPGRRRTDVMGTLS